MSGIAGVYHADGGPVEQTHLRRMVDVLAHRGPDGASVWCNGAVGFGHRMLHTTPESLKEVLPFVNPTAELAITADARIDNRAELLSRLRLDNRPPEQIADSQLILAAYENWGEGCAEHLLGDFAFAIWDGRERRLFCARDPMGVKPFYYHHCAGTFVFASEIKAILSLPDVPRTLNETKLGDFLVPVFKDQVSTYYKDISRLSPAHIMTIGYAGIQIRSYWNLDPSHELRLSAEVDYIDAFRELFTEAVRCRLRSAFPVGSNLSGGLDSSSITCTASKLLSANGRHPLHTFSAIFPTVAKKDPRIDERTYVEAVLATGDFAPHYVRADRCRPLEDVTWHKDEAWPAPGLYMGRAIFRSAREHGVRVLLTGFGGDVVVSYGYEHLEELAQTGNWADFARVAHSLADLRPQTRAARYLRQFGLPYLSDLARKWRWWALAKQVHQVAPHFAVSRARLFLLAQLRALIPEGLRTRWPRAQNRAASAGAVWGLNHAISPGFARRIGLAQRLQTFEACGPERAPPRELQLLALTDGHLEYAVNVFDQTAATFSLEPRYPFLDRRLVEFCLAVPFEHKLWHGWTRAIFRRAMDNILPPEVQWRVTKGNLSANVRLRLLEERETLDEVIHHDPTVIQEYIDIRALRRAYRRYLDEPASASEADLFTVFLSVNLAIWLRQSGLARRFESAPKGSMAIGVP